MKRKHKIVTAELIWGAEMTQTAWPEKQTEVREDFIRGIGSEVLYQMIRAGYKTEPDKMAIKDLFDYSTSTSYRKETSTTTEVNSSGQSRPKQKPWRISVGD